MAGRTTNFERTKATLQGVLTGLYPEADGVPIVTAGDHDEILYANVKACKRLGPLLKSRLAAAKGLSVLGSQPDADSKGTAVLVNIVSPTRAADLIGIMLQKYCRQGRSEESKQHAPWSHIPPPALRSPTKGL